MLTLRADCERCFGLCCVAPAFSASADFAVGKPAGQPCRHLGVDFGCTIHDHLRQRGFPGCTVFDCFGAGQQVAQVTFGGRDWRSSPELARPMFEVFGVMRQLHELLWYLHEALTLTLTPAEPLRADIEAMITEIERLAGQDADTLGALDTAAHRDRANTLLLRASELARAGMAGPDHRGADLIGRKLGQTDLRGASLRGAYLIGADLSNADLSMADVIGADFRGANLSKADLSTAIFLTQAQLDAARGDTATGLPATLRRPTHWVSQPIQENRSKRSDIWSTE
ncbi:MAG TPA: pentapeptide repeat-containing protein [Pseudonocardiaceae bacterium]|nr:pentapeptide repeat-containing protein [Pseudonocardiaceae bacterium]